MYHRQIRLADALIARAILETAGTTAALILVYTVARLAGIIPPYQDLGRLMAGWLFMAWLSFSVGLIFAAGSERFEFVEKLVPPFQYLTLPVCGMFYMVAWLPSGAQKLALYVPLVHCFELFRAGVFGDSVQTFYDVDYLLKCCLFITAIGLFLINRVRDHIKFE